MDTPSELLAIHTVVMALISTHPDKAMLRKCISTIGASMQVVQAGTGKMTISAKRDYKRAVNLYLDQLDTLIKSNPRK